MSLKKTQACLLRLLIAAPVVVALLPGQVSAEPKTISAELAPLLEKGYKQIVSNKFDAAVKTLNQAVKLDKESISARRYLAYALVKNNQPRQAIAELNTITKAIKPTYFEWCTFGEAYLNNGSLDQAESCYKQALKKSPRNEYARSGLIRVDLKAGNYQQAMSSATEGMKKARGKGNYDYYKNLYIAAYALENKGNQHVPPPAVTQPVYQPAQSVQPSVGRPDDHEELLRHVRDSQRRGVSAPSG